MFIKAALLLVALSVVLASPHGPYNPYPSQPYAFKYGVQDSYSGQNHGRKEYSDGHVVKGTYSVDLPGGTRQRVDYQADKYNGYQARVSYTGVGY
ncbi:larval cuticle protein A3A isoform X2 [Procambarus clarkii]|uniref:larval cuticle protein A3A isoform X2 n=1 Tax=Procambarus clarkii TaxID=6728 RepID=UPI001E6757D5|nr:larval cuticle protein A3A-like [Procambarus clarkii]